MMQVRKQQLTELDISSWATVPLDELETLATTNKLHRFSSWLLPQLVAHFGTWQPHDNIREMVLANCTTNHQRALYRLAMISRSCLLAKQVAEPEYAQLTPLILCGLKTYKNIPYEHWRHKKDLELILEPKLLAAVADQPQLDISQQRLLELQNIGLTIMTGRRSGQLNNPSTHYGLNRLAGTELAGVNKLTQMLLCQTWLAHPQNRHHNMILNPHNWDQMPQPLIAWQPLGGLGTTTKISEQQLMPWLDTV